MEELPIPQRTFSHVLAQKAARNGAKPFILFEDRSCSYQDFDAITNRVANGFTKHGVKRGEHVAFLLTNCPEILFIYCGLFKMGGVAVPVNVAAKGELLVYFLEQSDATLLVADAALVDRFLEVQDRLPRIRGLVVLADDAEAPDLVKRVGARSRVPVYDYHELEQGSSEAPDISARFCDIGYLSYTSGTTGPSKGSMATHAHAITQGID